MAIILQGTTSGAGVDTDAYSKSIRTQVVPRGAGYSIAMTTGATVVAAALAANSPVFAMRFSPTASTFAYIEKLYFNYTTITAYTTPVTKDRRLALYRGAGAATAAGTQTAAAQRKLSTTGSSQFDNANGGDIRFISAGTALTVTGVTFETEPLITVMTMVHAGAAGAYVEATYDFSSSPIILAAGQLIAVRNPVALDAAGTWQAQMNVQWYEAAAY